MNNYDIKKSFAEISPLSSSEKQFKTLIDQNLPVNSNMKVLTRIGSKREPYAIEHLNNGYGTLQQRLGTFIGT